MGWTDNDDGGACCWIGRLAWGLACCRRHCWIRWKAVLAWDGWLERRSVVTSCWRWLAVDANMGAAGPWVLSAMEGSWIGLLCRWEMRTGGGWHDRIYRRWRTKMGKMGAASLMGRCFVDVAGRGIWTLACWIVADAGPSSVAVDVDDGDGFWRDRVEHVILVILGGLDRAAAYLTGARRRQPWLPALLRVMEHHTVLRWCTENYVPAMLG
ncbi:hypothetical protein ACLOJK_015482 [Asimina triloba]